MAYLFGIGNPLLDVSAEVPASLLEKYGLKNGDAIIAEEKHFPLFDELEKEYECSYLAGGSCQNAVRACQWMYNIPDSSCFLGCTGSDEHSKILEKVATEGNVKVLYEENTDTCTGVCLCLIVDKDRSMVARLGAATKYTSEHLALEPQQAALLRSTIIVATGFFLTVNPPALLSIGQHAAEFNKPFVLNVGAPFIIDFFFEHLSATLPFVDYVICNETEAAALGKKLECESEDLKEIALKVAALPKTNTQRSRTVIFTRGADPAFVAFEGEVKETNPPAVASDAIVDTNGAGDSFVGGFIAGLMKNLDTMAAAQVGHYVASVTIQTSGTSFEGKTPEYQA